MVRLIDHHDLRETSHAKPTLHGSSRLRASQEIPMATASTQLTIPKLTPFPDPKRAGRKHYKHTPKGLKRPQARHLALGWMNTNGFRFIRAHESAGLPLPSAQTIADFLEAGALRNGRSRLAHSTLLDLAEEAAVSCLQEYDPAIYERQARRGRIGGLKSRRGATFTLEHLDAVKGMSIREQAEALGCSTATVSNLRKKAKQQAMEAEAAALDKILSSGTDETRPEPSLERGEFDDFLDGLVDFYPAPIIEAKPWMLDLADMDLSSTRWFPADDPPVGSLKRPGVSSTRSTSTPRTFSLAWRLFSIADLGVRRAASFVRETNDMR
ncbi:hypothetical protein [Agromyces aerolatus]|uniref:hypothetical protein n=1 Tax=Agromyces sp. LY-1074 TaxID=3074080 RepID=UPI00285DD7E7|nr:MULTISPECIES: hypothetical protein [unclassified Agromyces]MDR5699954.1 hypothetical protein [Agromyces sp. LY-1074]MDR5706234.1 hypothetical protein [Agromyces sp. LY-1358]